MAVFLRRYLLNRDLLLYIWIGTLIFAAGALCPSPVKAEAGLTVDQTSSLALMESAYIFSYKPGAALHPTDPFYLKIPKEFLVDNLNNGYGTIYAEVKDTDEGNYYSNYFDYELLKDETGQTVYKFLANEPIPDTATIVIKANQETGFRLRNPWEARTYTFGASLDNITFTEASVDITYGEDTAVTSATLTAERAFTQDSGPIVFSFETSRPLTEGANDFIHIALPKGYTLNFGPNNIVYGTEKLSSPVKAIMVNDQAPESVRIYGGGILIPAAGLIESAASLEAYTYTVELAGDALIHPNTAGAYTFYLSSSSDKIQVPLHLEVAQNPLAVLSSSTKQYARNVTYTLTFKPKYVYDESHALVIALPDVIQKSGLFHFTENNVQVNGEKPSSVGFNGELYVGAPKGRSYQPGDTVRITFPLMNPMYTSNMKFGVKIDSLQTDYNTVFVTIEPSAPVYDPYYFKQAFWFEPGRTLTIPSSPSNELQGANGSFTAAMWLKPEAADAEEQVLLHKNQSASDETEIMLYLQNGKLHAYIDGYTIASETVLPVGQWTHAAFTKTNNGTANLFINGVLESSQEGGNYQAKASSLPVTLGAASDGFRPYTGKIDELSVWSMDLGEQSLTLLMYEGAGAYQTSDILQAYYRFDALPSGALTDSARGNDALFPGTAPSADHLTFSTGLTPALTGSLSGSDPEGDPLQYFLASPPYSGNAIVNEDGSFQYTPDSEMIYREYTTDSFTYKTFDGVRLSDEAAVSVTVYHPLRLTALSVNSDPVELPDGVTTLNYRLENGKLNQTVSIGAASAIGQQLTVNNQAAAQSGTVEVALTPANNEIPIKVSYPYSGEEKLYTLNLYMHTELDTAADLVTEEHLKGTNPDLLHVSRALNLTEPAGLPDGVSVTWAWDSAYNIYLDPTGQITKPTAEDITFPLHAYISKDGFQLVKSFEVTLLKNQAPSAVPVTFTTVANAVYSGVLEGYDSDGDPLTFSLAYPPEPAGDAYSAGPSHGTLLLRLDGSFDYTPERGYVGEDRFTFQVYDGFIYSSPVEAVIRLYDPASAEVRLLSLEVDGTAIPLKDNVYDYSYVVPLGVNSVSVRAEGNPGATITINGSTTAETTVGLSNGEVLLSIRVQSENPADFREYHLKLRSETVDEQVFRIFQDITAEAILGTNQSLDEVTTDMNLHPSFVPEDISLAWASDRKEIITDNGSVLRPIGPNVPVTLTLTVSKGGYSYSKSFSVTVLGLNTVNEPPTAYDASASARGKPATGKLLAADPEHQSLIFRLKTDGSKGTATVQEDGSFTYVPFEYKYVQDSFTFEVTDGEQVSAPATVTIQVYGPYSSTADLSGILAGGTHAASVDGTVYTHTLPNSVDSIRLEAVGYPGQTITINGTGANGQNYPVPLGDSTFNFRVFSEDGSAFKEYKLYIHRQTDQELVDQAWLELTEADLLGSNPSLSQVTQNLVLPSSRSGASIAWYVSPGDSAYLQANGTVNRPYDANKTVTLSATLFKAAANKTKSFSVTILKQDTPEAPILSALYIGGAVDSLSPVALTAGETYYNAAVTGSTSIYVKPQTADGVHISVQGKTYKGPDPIRIDAADYQLNLITIDLQHPASPTVRTAYTLSILVDSGLAAVTDVTSNGSGTTVISGSRINISDLPADINTADLTIHTLDPEAYVPYAMLSDSSAALNVYNKRIIQVPLNGTPVNVKFAVQDRNGAIKLYTLVASQSEPTPPPPEPVPGFAVLDVNGMDLTVGFDIQLTSADLNRMRIRIGQTDYSLEHAQWELGNKSLSIKLASLLPSPANEIFLVLDEGAVTGIDGGSNKAAAVSVVSFYTTGGSNDGYLDVSDLIQILETKTLPPEAIIHILNSIDPRILNRVPQ